MDCCRTEVPETLSGFAEALRGRQSADGSVAIVVAHPDDETIGIGGHLRQLRNACIIHVTDGAPRNMRDAAALGLGSWQSYAELRRRELAAAASEAGMPCGSLISLGLPDQQAVYSMPQIARSLQAIFHDRNVRHVCTHPYEGGHPDHDAIAFAVRAACKLIASGDGKPPQIIEMAFYHAGPIGPIYQRFAADPPAPGFDIRLDEAQWTAKRRMLDCHASQRQVLAAFTSPVERFRLAPSYDFTLLPNGGDLLYESWQLGMRGQDWTVEAAAATAELLLEQAPEVRECLPC